MTSEVLSAPVRRASAAGIATVGTLCIIYVISQFLRNSVGVIAPNLAAEMQLSAVQIGLLASAFFFSFAAAQIPLGLAIDRFGPKRCMLVCAAVIVLGALLFAQAASATTLIAGRILLGLGASSFLMAPLAIYARWFPPQRFSTLAGLHVGIGSLGALLATAPFASVVGLFGWRTSFIGVAAITVLAVVVIMLVVRDAPPGAERLSRGDAGGGSAGGSWRDSVLGAIEAIRLPGVWRLFVMNLAVHSTFVFLVGLWGGPYLTHVYGYDLTARGDFLFAPALAQMVGAVVWGPMDRVFGGHKVPVLIGMGLSALALLVLAAAGTLPFWALLATFVVVGFSTAVIPVVVAHGKALFPAHLLGRGMTILNMASMGGVFLCQSISGAVIELFPAVNGVYPLAAYRTVFALQALLIVTVSWVYLRARDPERVSADLPKN
jgi:MFS family permease